MALEREIKLRFNSAEEARERILALGATPLLGRRLQQDSLFDSDDDRLRLQQSTLRVRSESGRTVLTFKGPVLPGAVKIREEHETVVSDGLVLQTIIEKLGLHVWFRYEKYREEFTAQDVVIAVDETPVGVFVEIEGGEAAIHKTATALGKSPTDYITDSYRFLFLQHRDANGLAGHDMLFAAVSAPDLKAGRAIE